MEEENPELYFPELSPIENDLLRKNYSNFDEREILIITIDVGDGRKDQIRAYEQDDSDQLALDFCYKHKLGARAKLLLADEIEKYLKIALSRVKAKNASNGLIKESSGQTPTRPRRNQSFTQKSMQVKRNMSRKKSPFPQNKINSPMLPTRFTSVQDTSDSPKLKHQRSLSRNTKTYVPNSIDHSPKPKTKEISRPSPKRSNSLYEKPPDLSPDKPSVQ